MIMIQTARAARVVQLGKPNWTTKTAIKTAMKIPTFGLLVREWQALFGQTDDVDPSEWVELEDTSDGTPGAHLRAAILEHKSGNFIFG